MKLIVYFLWNFFFLLTKCKPKFPLHVIISFNKVCQRGNMQCFVPCTSNFELHMQIKEKLLFMSIIEIQNLTFAYNKQIILENINLTVYKNDFLAIIGPNGGGKSTLLAGLTNSSIITSEANAPIFLLFRQFPVLNHAK